MLLRVQKSLLISSGQIAGFPNENATILVENGMMYMLLPGFSRRIYKIRSISNSGRCPEPPTRKNCQNRFLIGFVDASVDRSAKSGTYGKATMATKRIGRFI
jgi:hypothetical protein